MDILCVVRFLGNWFFANYCRFCFWHFLVYDSPQQHPRISDDEKNYILDNITGPVDDEEETQIPWRSIILSGPIWITIAAHWGAAWGFLTLMTQAPTYFNFIHGWNINAVNFVRSCHVEADPVLNKFKLNSYFISSRIDHNSITFPDRDTGGNAALAQNDLLLLLLDVERLAAPYEANELDKHQEIGHLRLHRRTRSLHHCSRIQRMLPVARGHLHDDRYGSQRRYFRLHFGELRRPESQLCQRPSWIRQHDYYMGRIYLAGHRWRIDE